MRPRLPERRWIGLGGLALPVGAALVWALGPGPATASVPLSGALIAHRGGIWPGPENSIEAVEHAARTGADAVEIDVRWGPEHSLVCAHDAEQADGAPGLPELLDRALGLGLRVELDVKTGPLGDRTLIRRVLREIARRDARDRVWVSAFQPVAAWQVRRADPAVALGWPMPATGFFALDALLAWDGPARWLGASHLEPADALATDARLDRWAERGWAIEVWTVEQPERAAALRGRGAAVVVDRLAPSLGE